MTLWLVAAAAVASEAASPARLCADAAEGSEVEVCLQLVVAYPAEVDAISAALRAHLDRGSQGDQGLLGALLQLSDPLVGPAGARRLGELGDPRGIPALELAVRVGDLDLALAAVDALGAYPTAVASLSTWLADPRQHDEVRVASARSLGRIGSDPAADALVIALRRRGLPRVVRAAIVDTVSSAYPARAAELDRAVSVDGAPWLAAGGAIGLGYAMGAVGYLGREPLAPVGAATGAVGGATAGLLLGRARPIEADDAALITAAGASGLLAGVLVGGALDAGGPGARGPVLGGVVGEGVGFVAGAALSGAHAGDVGDVAEMVGLGVATGVGVGALASLAGDSRGGLRLGAAGGLVVGSVIGGVVGPAVDLHGADVSMLALTMAWGAGAGALMPAFDVRRVAVGASVGAITGFVLAPMLEPTPDVLSGALVGGAFGGLAGLGVGRMLDQGRVDLHLWGAAVGLTAGLPLGGLLTAVSADPIDVDDAVLTAIATGWAAAQVIGFERVLRPNRVAQGALWLAPAVVGSGVALLSPSLVEAPVDETLAAASIGLWGAYFGGAVALLLDRPALVPILVGGDVGLLVGAVGVSPLVGVPSLVVGFGDAGGLLGGVTAALVSAMVTDRGDVVMTASLVGVAVGFGGGAGLGAWLRARGLTRDIAWSPSSASVRVLPGLVPGDAGPNAGLVIEGCW